MGRKVPGRRGASGRRRRSPSGQPVEDSAVKWSPAVGAAAEPGLSGVDGLIGDPIAGSFEAAADIRGQGSLTVPLQECRRGRRRVARIRLGLRPDEPSTGSPRASSIRRSPWPTITCSPSEGRPRVCQDLPGPAGALAQEEALPTAAGRLAMADQPRRHDAGIISYQDIAGVQHLGNLGEDPVLPGSPMPVDDHQPRRSRGSAGCCDQLWGRSKSKSEASTRPGLPLSITTSPLPPREPLLRPPHPILQGGQILANRVAERSRGPRLRYPPRTSSQVSPAPKR